MKMEPVVWLTAIRGKLSRRYALPGSGSGTGTIDAIPCSTSNVWPQSRDRVNRIWSLWKSSQATYTSPPGPTATVAPWFCEFGEWLSEMIGVQLRPPSEERWSTIFVPWLPSKKARDVHVPVTGPARVVDRDPLFVGDTGVPRTAEFVARGVVAGENNGCEVVRCPEVRVPSEDEPTREFCRRRSEREPRQVDSALAVRGDHGIASDFPSRVVHGRCEALRGGVSREARYEGVLPRVPAVRRSVGPGPESAERDGSVRVL